MFGIADFRNSGPESVSQYLSDGVMCVNTLQ